MRTYKTEGIVLKRSNFGEAEKLLTIFTKHYGKIRVRAPGIRKITSRKAPHLELFNLATIFLVTGKSMDIVTEAQTLNNFSSLKKDLQKVGLAYYFCELVDSLCPERQENREAYELLTKSLKELESIHYNDINHCSEDFTNQILWSLGYLPKERELKGTDLERFVENILEKRIKSKNLFS